MRWCKNCVEPDTRPGQKFNDDGICTPCQYALRVVPVDWEARREELRGIVEWAKERKTGRYDCVLGVSGGKDSMRLAYFAREVGLNPLLVCATFVPQHITDLGAYNLSNIVDCGFDLETVNVPPETCPELIRIAFLKHGNWVKATEMFLMSSMPRLALTHGIPLACLGENPLITVGSGYTDNSDLSAAGGDARDYGKLNTMANGDLSHFSEEGFSDNDLFFYTLPTRGQLDVADTRFIYLGYYIEDWFATANYRFAAERGFKAREGFSADPANTGCVQNYVSLDEDFNTINQHFKYLKFGFGFTAQQLSHDVREGLMTRAEAIELVHKYDGRCHEYYIDAFCKFINITRDQFEETRDRYRNPDVWMKDNNGEWVHRVPLE